MLRMFVKDDASRIHGIGKRWPPEKREYHTSGVISAPEFATLAMVCACDFAPKLTFPGKRENPPRTRCCASLRRIGLRLLSRNLSARPLRLCGYCFEPMTGPSPITK